MNPHYEKQDLLEYFKRQKFPKELINAFKKVPREKFIPLHYRDKAYDNTPITISNYTRISQPYTILVMLELLEIKEGQKILEIGSGTGYVLALMSELNQTGEIIGLEIDEKIANKSKEELKKYKNIIVLNKDGRKGAPEEGPFDRIIVSAAYNHTPYELLEQLNEEGIIVTPVGTEMIKIIKEKNKIKEESQIGFFFVPIR